MTISHERQLLMGWISDLVDKSSLNEEEQLRLNEIYRILELAPDNLTCTAGPLLDKLEWVDRFTPVYIRIHDKLISIRKVVEDSLDNLFDGDDGNGNAVVIEGGRFV